MVRQPAARSFARERVTTRALILTFAIGAMLAGGFLALIALGSSMARAESASMRPAAGQHQMITIEGMLARKQALANGRTPPPTESRVAAAGLLPAFDEKGRPDLFGTRIVPVASAPGLADWTAVRAVAARDESRLAACAANSAACGHPRLAAWSRLMAKAKTLDGAGRLAFVSREINRIAAYESDAARYGKPDHWASPVAFLTGSGDCEDFVIAKYWTLKMLGVPEASMRVALVRDRVTRLDHAVLAVSEGRDSLILDNQSDRTLPDSAIDRYAALYSLGAGGQWMHAVFVAGADVPASLITVIEPAGGALSLRGGFDEAAETF